MSERFFSNDSLLILNEAREVIQYDRLIILEENQKKGKSNQ
ncbi:MAG TPA: hypothetical protein VGA21_13605 [Cyclobacteriaceae bacterium]